MGVKQGLGVLLEAANLLKQAKNIIFLLVGDGAARRQLEERAAALELTNLKFLPLQSDEQFMEMLATTDLSVVTQQRTVSDIAFPSKIVTVLSAALPVVASVSASSDVARVVEESGGGVVVEPEDAGQLAQAVGQLSCDLNRISKMKISARRYAMAHWSPERVLPLMEAELLKASAHTIVSPVPRLERPRAPLPNVATDQMNFTTERVLSDSDD
jgi:colanic acid biosynthesis glycosyl transferase WcaI